MDVVKGALKLIREYVIVNKVKNEVKDGGTENSFPGNLTLQEISVIKEINVLKDYLTILGSPEKIIEMYKRAENEPEILYARRESKS